MEAAWRLGLYWPTICYGQAECAACHVVVLEGEANLSEVGAEEADAIRTRVRPRDRRERRLACRMEVYGPVVVEKRGVRPK